MRILRETLQDIGTGWAFLAAILGFIVLVAGIGWWLFLHGGTWAMDLFLFSALFACVGRMSRL